jgi:2,3-bisphosphoglycerate-independent phosphoglycerate mutase
MTTPKPVVLCILDGWGLKSDQTGNAPALAATPTFDKIMAECPAAQLITHGPEAGLPRGQMGNSEVGHTNIGAGRVVAMDLGQIDLSIETGSFEREAELVDFVETLKSTGGTAHLMGVISDGGVHGHLEHVIAAAAAISNAGVPVVLHAITDGRDVPPRSSDRYVAELQNRLPEGVTVGTVTGRYFALDRDNRWERVSQAYRAMMVGTADYSEVTATDAVAAAYERGETDEFILPTIIDNYAGMTDGDGLFCLNFRADRAREILAALCDPAFDGFDTGPRAKLAAQLGMVQYSDSHNTYLKTVFPKRNIVNTLGAWVAEHGKRQFRLAETEKYPHVTFFLNGGKEIPEVGEDRFMPKSPKVATYDLQPEMSSAEVTAKFVEAIGAGYDLIVVNYANPDMVGHTGDLNAAMAACAAVDAGLAQVLPALKAAGGAMVITADHGNCETMIDPDTVTAHTAHTLNPVPVAVVGGPNGVTLRNGILADLAPTVLELMGLPQPDEMTGTSLIQR